MNLHVGTRNQPKKSKINSGAMSLPLRGLVLLTSIKKSRRRKEWSKREMEERKAVDRKGGGVGEL